MTMSPSPSSESRASPLQNSIYIGVTIQNILYGIELVLYIKTMGILLSNRGAHKKSNLFYALFSSVMVFSITIWVVTTAVLCQKMWLQDSNYPGGPDVYWEENLSVWYMDLGATAVILLQLMTDGLMIYRCRIICNSYRVIVVPMFLWLSTLVLGVLVDWSSSLPNGYFFIGVASELALAYYSVSVFLNTILSFMICYRILQHGMKVREHLGQEYASSYFAVVTLVVESVLPYTLCGIAALVSLGVGSTTSEAFIPAYVMMMSISPQMLILRVLSGRAWEDNTSMRPGSTIKFSLGGVSESQCIDDGRPRFHVQGLPKVHLPEGRGEVVVSPV